MDRLVADRRFARVARSGSFSAAATQMGTSGGQTSKLEAHLGQRLLNRTTRAIALTQSESNISSGSAQF